MAVHGFSPCQGTTLPGTAHGLRLSLVRWLFALFDFDDFDPVVGPAGGAHVVRQFERMALRAGHHGPHLHAQVMRAAAVATDLGYSSFWQGTHNSGVSFRLS